MGAEKGSEGEWPCFQCSESIECSNWGRYPLANRKAMISNISSIYWKPFLNTFFSLPHPLGIARELRASMAVFTSKAVNGLVPAKQGSGQQHK